MFERSGRLSDYRVAFDLFSKIASILAYLHQAGHIIPHLILNDIMVVKDAKGDLDVKIDYKLSRFIDPKLDKPGKKGPPPISETWKIFRAGKISLSEKNHFEGQGWDGISLVFDSVCVNGKE